MITNPKKRRKRAYSVSYRIGWSYLRLVLLKKVFGESFYNKRITKLHQKNAQRTKDAILELNGLFIKVGQLISIMSNAVPKAFGSILESLQDNTPSSNFEATKLSIEKELGDSLSNLFDSFEESPLASASIGQVHKAVLKTGEHVAVKIQHPEIEELAKIDLAIIEKLIKLVSRFFKINGMDHVYNQVKQMIYEELDYTQEAQSMRTIKSNCKDFEGVVIPDVYTAYSSNKILTTTFCEGVKITNSQQLKSWNIDENLIAEKLVLVFCEMTLNHGIYHADPHPGNLLVNKKGEIIILDFGAVGILSDEMRENIPTLVRAVASKDQDLVLDALKNMGFIANGKEAEKSAQKLIITLTEFIESGINIREFSFDNLNDSNVQNLRKNISIKELTSTIQVPKDWILLERTMMLLDGVTAKISPEYKPFDTIKPYLKKLVLKNGGLQKIIMSVIKKQASILLSLPKKVNEFLTKANKGELQIEVKNYDKNTNKLYAGKQQLIYGLMFLLGLVMAFVSKQHHELFYEKLFLGLSVLFALLFLHSIWKNRK